MRVPKSPWPAAVIRDTTKRAVDRVGGPVGFGAIGRTFQEAIITQAAFDLFMSAGASGPITVSVDDMGATLHAMRVVAEMESE